MVRAATEDNVFPMIPDLADKVFLVTGASSGIGAAVARALGAQRARAAVHYFSGEEGARAVIADVEKEGGQAVALRGDLTQVGAGELLVAAAVEHFGRPEWRIKNACNVIKPIPPPSRAQPSSARCSVSNCTR